MSGSDIKENQITQRLRKEGAEVFIGHCADHIHAADAIVYSSAIQGDNPEIISAKEKKLPIFKRAELLAKLMEDKKSITVAGAHGKTTTASMIASLLISANLNPSTAVGGILNGTMDNASLGEGQYFVAEVDESDGSFLYFSPYYSVITNIDFEHIDYYGNWDNILSAYREFIERTNKDGCIIACGEDLRLRKILSQAKLPYKTYGFSKQNDIYAGDIESNGYASRYECVLRGEDLGPFQLSIPGEHNILNSLACIGLGVELGVDPAVIRLSLKEFKGVQRRFQRKGDVNDIWVVDDYGHHPTEIAATLKAAKSFSRQRLVVIFQPHRYTRTKYLMDEFAQSLSLSDYLVITDIYAANEKAITGVTAERLYDKIKSASRSPVFYINKEKIVEHLLEIAKPGDIILTLGAGDITRISDELVGKLRERNEILL